MKWLTRKKVFLLLTCLGAGSSYAIDPARVPGQIINTYYPTQSEKSLPQLSPKLSQKDPSISKKSTPAAGVIANGEKLYLLLHKVTFKGNKVFSTAELNQIFASSLHKKISIADLERLTSEITAKYRNAGYILSQAYLPPQVIREGVVQINIVEGFIDQTRIEGNPGKSRVILEKYAHKAQQPRPFQIVTLEHEMLLANDIPGESVQALLTPSKTTTDSSDLTLVANHQWANGYVIYNNYGTRYLGPLQTSFGGNVNSLLFPGDSNALHFAVTSKTKQMQFAEFVHSQVVGSNGMNFLLGTNYMVTRPGFLLEDFNVVGRSFSIFSNLKYPMIRTRIRNLYLKVLGNYQNITSTILNSPFYQDRDRTLGLELDFDNVDRWRGSNTANVAVLHGFGIWGAQKHFYQSRPDGHPIFNKFTLNASRLQRLTDRFYFYVAMQGQYTPTPLLAAEQFSYGGPYFGRGYDNAEFTGDRGLTGKAELQFQTFPDKKFLQAAQYYIFYDGGVIWNIDGVNLPSKQSGTSTGLGVRLTFTPNLNGEAFIAKPLTTQETTLLALGENGRGARAYFQIALHD